MAEQNIAPVEYCQKQRERFIEMSVAEERKKQGQFFTPPDVARFMARLYPIRKRAIRLLDPGAGAGSAASPELWDVPQGHRPLCEGAGCHQAR